MTDLDKLEDLVTELYQFTIPMTKEAMNECLEEITEKVLAKREHRDKLNDLYPQWLFVLGDRGQEAELTIQSEMLATGHGHRWPEVQALGREMYNMNHPTQTPLSPIQPIISRRYASTPSPSDAWWVRYGIHWRTDTRNAPRAYIKSIKECAPGCWDGHPLEDQHLARQYSRAKSRAFTNI